MNHLNFAVNLANPEKDNTKINWNTTESARLIKAFMRAGRPDHMRLFLEDLFTDCELEQCTKRFEVARLILLGMPYEFITNQTGLSPKVIARISKKLNNPKGGLNIILRDLHPNGIR